MTLTIQINELPADAIITAHEVFNNLPFPAVIHELCAAFEGELVSGDEYISDEAIDKVTDVSVITMVGLPRADNCCPNPKEFDAPLSEIMMEVAADAGIPIVDIQMPELPIDHYRGLPSTTYPLPESWKAFISEANIKTMEAAAQVLGSISPELKEDYLAYCEAASKLGDDDGN